MDESSEDEVRKPNRLFGFMNRIRKFNSREELSNTSNDEENARGKKRVKEKHKKTKHGNSVKDNCKSEESLPSQQIAPPFGEPGQSSRGHVSVEDSTDDEEFAIKVLAAANHCRKKHGVKKLRLNKNMSSEAQERANLLASEKYLLDKSDEKYGTNIYQTTFDRSHPRVKAHEVIKAWYSEIENFNFEDEPEDFHDISNATQLLWKDSKEIGVGKASSPNGDILFVAVYFNPPGNIKGEFVEQIHSLGQCANLEDRSVSDLSYTSSDSDETKDYTNKNQQDTQKTKRKFLRQILGKIRKRSDSSSELGKNKDQHNANYTGHRRHGKYVINKTSNDTEEAEKKKGSFYVVTANELKQTRKTLRNNNKVSGSETLDYPLKMDSRQFQEKDTLPPMSKANDYPLEYGDTSENNVECIFLNKIKGSENDLESKINISQGPSETQEIAKFVESPDGESTVAETVNSGFKSQDSEVKSQSASEEEYLRRNSNDETKYSKEKDKKEGLLSKLKGHFVNPQYEVTLKDTSSPLSENTTFYVQRRKSSSSDNQESDIQTLPHKDKDISKTENYLIKTNPNASNSEEYLHDEDRKGALKETQGADRTTGYTSQNSLSLSKDINNTKSVGNYQHVVKPEEDSSSGNGSCSSDKESCCSDKKEKAPRIKTQMGENYERRTSKYSSDEKSCGNKNESSSEGEKTCDAGVKGSVIKVLDKFRSTSTEVSHSGKCFDCKKDNLSDECENKHNKESMEKCETINVNHLKHFSVEKLRINEKNSGNLDFNGEENLEKKNDSFKNMVERNQKAEMDRTQKDDSCSNEETLTGANTEEGKNAIVTEIKSSIETSHIMSPSDKSGVYHNEKYDKHSPSDEESKIKIPEIIRDKPISKTQVQPDEPAQIKLGKSIWLHDKTNDTSSSDDDDKKDKPMEKSKMLDDDCLNVGIYDKISNTSDKKNENISNDNMKDNIKHERDNKIIVKDSFQSYPLKCKMKKQFDEREDCSLLDDKINLKNIPRVKNDETLCGKSGENPKYTAKDPSLFVNEPITLGDSKGYSRRSEMQINTSETEAASIKTKLPGSQSSQVGFIAKFAGIYYKRSEESSSSDEEDENSERVKREEKRGTDERVKKLERYPSKGNELSSSTEDDNINKLNIQRKKQMSSTKKAAIFGKFNKNNERSFGKDSIASEKKKTTCSSSEEEELNEYPSDMGVKARNDVEDKKNIGVVIVEKRASKKRALMTRLPGELVSHFDKDNDPSLSDNNDPKSIEKIKNDSSIIEGKISINKAPKIGLESFGDLTEESSFHCGDKDEKTYSFDEGSKENNNSKKHISLDLYKSFDKNQNSKMATTFDESCKIESSVNLPTFEKSRNSGGLRRFFSGEYDIKNESKMKTELFLTFKEVCKDKSEDCLGKNAGESEKEAKELDSTDKDEDKHDVSNKWNIRYKNVERNQSKLSHGSDFQVSESEILNKSTPFAIYSNVCNSNNEMQDKNEKRVDSLSVITMGDRKIVSTVDNDSTTKLFPNLESSFKDALTNYTSSDEEKDTNTKVKTTKTITSSSSNFSDDEGDENCSKESVIKPKVRTKVLLKKSSKDERQAKSTPSDCFPRHDNNSHSSTIKEESIKEIHNVLKRLSFHFDDETNRKYSSEEEKEENSKIKSSHTIKETKSGSSSDQDAETKEKETEDKGNYKDLGELPKVSFLNKIKDLIKSGSNPTSGEESDDKERFTKEEEMIIRRLSTDQRSLSVEEKRDSMDSVDKSFRRGNLLNLIERYIRRKTSSVSSDDVEKQNVKKEQNYRPKLIETNRETAICDSSSTSSNEDKIISAQNKIKRKLRDIELNSDDTEDEAYRNKRKFRNMSNRTLATELRKAIRKLKHEKEMESESDHNYEGKSRIGEKLETSDYKKAILHFINIYRQKHHAEPVILEEPLSDLAEKRAKNLSSGVFGTLPSDWGENTFTFNSPVYFSTDGAEFIVESWYRRIVYHNFESDAETIDIRSGSFTQLVWKESKHVGIGWYEDRRENMTVLVAVFSPAGNVRGHYKDQIDPA